MKTSYSLTEGFLGLRSYKSRVFGKNLPLHINLLPEVKLTETLIDEKTCNKKNTGNILAQWLPTRLAYCITEMHQIDPTTRLTNVPDRVLRNLSDFIHHWAIQPNGSEGYRKAEVTVGGVDTQELSQQTMMSRKVTGLYFIGEAIDVTGWLGGYNFQWAWASGATVGLALI